MSILQEIFAYTKRNPRPRESVNLTIFILHYCGLWFPEETHWTIKSTKYLLFAICMQGFWFVGYVVSETIAMILSFSTGEILDITEAGFLLLTHYAEVFKVSNISKRNFLTIYYVYFLLEHPSPRISSTKFKVFSKNILKRTGSKTVIKNILFVDYSILSLSQPNSEIFK